MRLNPGHFNRHLDNLGQIVEWRRSYACPCANNMSGQPDPKHQACRGKGRIWDDPITTKVGSSRQAVTKRMQAMGVIDMGDQLLTVQESSAMYDMCARFDRVTLLNSTDVFSVPLLRGDVTERILKRVVSVDRCFWLDPVTRLPVDGKLPVVAADGTLSWPNGGEPPLGMQYSLTGVNYDEYFVYDALPNDRGMHAGARLPKSIQLRKWDLLGR